MINCNEIDMSKENLNHSISENGGMDQVKHDKSLQEMNQKNYFNPMSNKPISNPLSGKTSKNLKSFLPKENKIR